MTKEPAWNHDFRSDILFAFGLAAAAYVGWLVRGVLIILYVSALFAVVLTPVVQATGRVHIRGKRPFQGQVAVLVLVVILLGALTGFCFLAFPPVIRDLQAFGTSTPSQVPDLIEKFKSIPYVNRLNLNTSVVYSQLKDLAAQAATQVIVSVSELAGRIANILACFVLTLYFILEGDQAYRWFLALVPPSGRQRLDKTLRRAGVGMGKWLLGQASLMALLGLTSTTVFLLLDVRYAYALGVITGLLNVVPVLGVAISVVLALLWRRLTPGAVLWGWSSSSPYTSRSRIRTSSRA